MASMVLVLWAVAAILGNGRDGFKIFLRGRRNGKTLLRSSASWYLFVFVLSFIIGVVKANEPNLLKEFGGNLELKNDWARHLLKSMEWVKRKGTNGKKNSLISLKFQE